MPVWLPSQTLAPARLVLAAPGESRASSKQDRGYCWLLGCLALCGAHGETAGSLLAKYCQSLSCSSDAQRARVDGEVGNGLLWWERASTATAASNGSRQHTAPNLHCCHPATGSLRVYEQPVTKHPCSAKFVLFTPTQQPAQNTYLAPKMSFFARSMPETTFTLRIRDSSC